MNDETSLTAIPGSLERRVLLRSSGELSAAECDALEAALAHDDEASSFTRFVEKELPLAARAPRDFVAVAIDGAERAPRDFAAAAIAAAVGESAPRHVVAMPLLWKWSAATAAVAVLAFILTSQWPVADGFTSAPGIAAWEPRTTERLTARLSSLDQEISVARAALARGRHQRSTTL